MASQGSKYHAALDQRLWRAVRREVLERDGWTCCQYGKYGRMEVDHIQPLHLGGAPYALGNLQTLCRGCHIVKSRHEAETPTPGREAWRELVARMVEP